MKHRVAKDGDKIKMVRVDDYEEFTCGRFTYFVCRVGTRSWVAYGGLSGMVVCEIHKSKASLVKEVQKRLENLGEEGVNKTARLDRITALANHRRGLTTVQYKHYAGLPMRLRKGKTEYDETLVMYRDSNVALCHNIIPVTENADQI